MAIDFHSKDDHSRVTPLFQLDHDDYNRMNFLFQEFEGLTGVFVDPYGTTHMSSGHLTTLATIISGHHSPLESFLKKCGSQDKDVIVEGD